MFSSRCKRNVSAFYLLLPCIELTAQNPVYVPTDKPHRAEVRILILSTAAHQGFAGNEEVYLAEISFKSGENQLAKLVDTFSSSKQPIRRTVLLDHHPLRMVLTRKQECDSVRRDFFVGRDDNIFDLSAVTILKTLANESLPCFVVDHDATRLAKSNKRPTG